MTKIHDAELLDYLQTLRTHPDDRMVRVLDTTPQQSDRVKIVLCLRKKFMNAAIMPSENQAAILNAQGDLNPANWADGIPLKQKTLDPWHKLGDKNYLLHTSLGTKNPKILAATPPKIAQDERLFLETFLSDPLVIPRIKGKQLIKMAPEVRQHLIKNMLAVRCYMFHAKPGDNLGPTFNWHTDSGISAHTVLFKSPMEIQSSENSTTILRPKTGQTIVFNDKLQHRSSPEVAQHGQFALDLSFYE
ncbi:MAG: hypothetical protein CL570_06605 [Alphaproteobacteria bacterium]|nr:hypothetical protein [Alphaproteobacteria bacterium]HCQ71675.1 hypothetical protein [Rhodospirillaceae bacterium]|tara:strand:+ start:39859 stop:40596 length:738 start_codon:yes stop_codon:yes gene_type:complete